MISYTALGKDALFPIISEARFPDHLPSENRPEGVWWTADDAGQVEPAWWALLDVLTPLGIVGPPRGPARRCAGLAL